jgi:hypothetical protein
MHRYAPAPDVIPAGSACGLARWNQESHVFGNDILWNHIPRSGFAGIHHDAPPVVLKPRRIIAFLTETAFQGLPLSVCLGLRRARGYRRPDGAHVRASTT